MYCEWKPFRCLFRTGDFKSFSIFFSRKKRKEKFSFYRTVMHNAIMSCKEVT